MQAQSGPHVNELRWIDFVVGKVDPRVIQDKMDRSRPENAFELEPDRSTEAQAKAVQWGLKPVQKEFEGVRKRQTSVQARSDPVQKRLNSVQKRPKLVQKGSQSVQKALKAVQMRP